MCYCNQCPTTMSSIFHFKIATNCLRVAADLVRESDCKQVDYNGLWGLWNFKSNYIVLDSSLYLHIWYLVPTPPLHQSNVENWSVETFTTPIMEAHWQNIVFDFKGSFHNIMQVITLIPASGLSLLFGLPKSDQWLCNQEIRKHIAQLDQVKFRMIKISSWLFSQTSWLYQESSVTPEQLKLSTVVYIRPLCWRVFHHH